MCISKSPCPEIVYNNFNKTPLSDPPQVENKYIYTLPPLPALPLPGSTGACPTPEIQDMGLGFQMGPCLKEYNGYCQRCSCSTLIWQDNFILAVKAESAMRGEFNKLESEMEQLQSALRIEKLTTVRQERHLIVAALYWKHAEEHSEDNAQCKHEMEMKIEFLEHQLEKTQSFLEFQEESLA